MRIIRFVGEDGCLDAGYRDHLAVEDTAVIDTFSVDRNVTVDFKLDGRWLRLPIVDEVRDLVDLAVSVYVADELVARADEDDEWTREFDVLIPVREPVRWQAGDRSLAAALEFLSGDRYRFTWPERSALPTGRRHRAHLGRRWDAACLFSGGIDSLLGAYQLLSEGRRILLVGHQADPVTASAQSVLARELARMFPGQSALIQCRAARARRTDPTYCLPPKVEETHRPRSFLFLALAVAVARATHIEEIYMPENGMIALNPPAQISRVGTHSTRTAHPIYLTRFLQFLRDAEIYTGMIRNPFLYVSKTDMLRGLTPALIPLVQRSVSCSHPSRYQDEGVRHCGYCVPCMHRRAAMMVCGLDRNGDYAFDVCTGRPSRVKRRPLNLYKQADPRAVTALARRVQRASDMKLHMLILSHGHFSPSVGEVIGPKGTADYAPWMSMMRRWANDYLAEFEGRSLPAMQTALGLQSPTPVRTS